MSDFIKYALGIDASKDKVDACLLIVDLKQDSKIKAQHKFPNTLTGFKDLHVWCKKHCKQAIPLQILMEATGVYYEKLAIYLVDHGYSVSVVLPNKARKYMQSLGLKSKNDSIDAKGLALMCSQQKFDSWQPLSKYYYELRQLTRHHQSMQESKTSIANQLHALQHSAYASKEVTKQLKKTIDLFDKQIEQIKLAIIKHIGNDETVNRKVKNICKIKGIDVLSVATVLAETNGFTLFKNIGQVVSYAGYDVVENQSGTHTGKTRISKKGNSRIRRILHMPAFNVVRYEQRPFANLYERVYEKTKIKMKAYVAVQKKLLVMIYTLWEKEEAYQADFKNTSGNVESKALFPLGEGEVKLSIDHKKIVPQLSSTTQDGHRTTYRPRPSFR
ncbi:MAG TPA: IS110 family transposase [Chitinophagales bacterium]|nr:IS110 family transposase [Chitinophagales bacterium]